MANTGSTQWISARTNAENMTIEAPIPASSHQVPGPLIRVQGFGPPNQ